MIFSDGEPTDDIIAEYMTRVRGYNAQQAVDDFMKVFGIRMSSDEYQEMLQQQQRYDRIEYKFRIALDKTQDEQNPNVESN